MPAIFGIRVLLVRAPRRQAEAAAAKAPTHTPDWRSVHADDVGATHVKSVDWSDNVAPFWDHVIRSALTPAGLAGVLGAGWGTLKGALVMPLMKKGYEMGLIKFVAITGQKNAA